jgi:cell division protein ZapA
MRRLADGTEPSTTERKYRDPPAQLRQKKRVMSEHRPIKVHLLGKEYSIACSEDEQHDLLIAARFLDERMRKIRETGRVIGTERIAIMAALNIAHELVQAQNENRRLSQGLANVQATRQSGSWGS